MAFKNLYALLGLSPAATEAEIKEAMREKAQAQSIGLDDLKFCQKYLLDVDIRKKYNAKLYAEFPEVLQQMVEEKAAAQAAAKAAEPAPAEPKAEKPAPKNQAAGNTVKIKAAAKQQPQKQKVSFFALNRNPIPLYNEVTGEEKTGYYGASAATIVLGPFAPLIVGDFAAFAILLGSYFVLAFVGLWWVCWVCNIVLCFLYCGIYTKNLIRRGFKFNGTPDQNARAAQGLKMQLTASNTVGFEDEEDVPTASPAVRKKPDIQNPVPIVVHKEEKDNKISSTSNLLLEEGCLFDTVYQLPHSAWEYFAEAYPEENVNVIKSSFIDSRTIINSDLEYKWYVAILNILRKYGIETDFVRKTFTGTNIFDMINCYYPFLYYSVTNEKGFRFYTLKNKEELASLGIKGGASRRPDFYAVATLNSIEELCYFEEEIVMAYIRAYTVFLARMRFGDEEKSPIMAYIQNKNMWINPNKAIEHFNTYDINYGYPRVWTPPPEYCYYEE